LDQDYFLGGRLKLDVAAASAAIGALAEKLDMSDVELAEGILAIANAKMADAMRTVTVKQGIDPREFSLVAFGGAGPMHAVWLAAELDIREVIIPWSPGTFSAWGMLHTDMRHDVVRGFFKAVTATTSDEIADVLASLESGGRAILTNEGIDQRSMYFSPSADLRYVGQEYAVNIPLAKGTVPADVETAFHDAHLAKYGHSNPKAAAEFVNLRVAAMGRLERKVHSPKAVLSGGDERIGQRCVVFGGAGQDTLILMRDRLETGTAHRGPAIIIDQGATTIVPPGWSSTIDEFYNIVVARDPSR
jgi:N-methylhydantoinase A